MPHISIKMYPGRTEEAKKEIAEKFKDLTIEAFGCEPKYVSVSFKEVEPSQWKETMAAELESEEIFIEADF